VFAIKFNDIRTPFSASGIRPLGYNEWLTFYNKWIVNGSKLKCTITHITGEDLIATLTPSRDSTLGGAGNVVEMIPRPRTRYTMGDNRQGHMTLQNFIKSKQMFGLNEIRETENLQGSFTAGPTTGLYWLLGLQNVDFSTATAGVVLFEMTFYVKFFNRKTVEPSEYSP